MLLRLIRVALRNLGRRKLRTLLVLQGVIWGTALGILPPAIIRGSTQHARSKGRELSMDRLLLRQDPGRRSLRWDLVDSLRERLAGRVEAVAGYGLVPSAPHVLLACDQHALEARGLQLERGRFLTAQDVEAGAPVCVLEAALASALFGGEEALGQEVEVAPGESLTVVGVTAPRPDASQALDEFGYRRDHALNGLVEASKRYLGVIEDERNALLTQDRLVLVPRSRLPAAMPLWIEIRAEPSRLLPLRDELRADFIGQGFEPIIYVNAILPVLYGKSLDTLLELNRVVFLLCILVGTAIVCAVMILSVLERRHEIAIRRVEGARRWHIALQFVVETGTVCAVGGVIGVPTGLLLAAARCAIEPLESVAWTLPPVESVVMVSVVTLVGLVGGVLPAYRATRVDPVEVLRTE